MNFIILLNKFGKKKNNPFFFVSLLISFPQFSQDYQEFNAIRLAELEKLYQNKLETMKNEFIKRHEQQEVSKTREVYLELDSVKKEHRVLIEQNQSLKTKLG